MLSPGQDHLLVPRTYRENLKYRERVIEASRRKVYRKGLIEICRQDILFYINTFVFQFNPKKKSERRVGPFITWGFQEAALLDRPETTGRKGILWCYEHDKTAVVEKSRDMGASWLFLIFQDWLGLFHAHTKTLNISRSAEAVDDKSADSLFWKIRFMHKYLPRWLKGVVEERSMFFEYSRTEGQVTGEASTERSGSGGRGAVVFIDEFSKIKNDVQLRQSTASVADCRFFNGTHNGTDTEFYRLTQSPEIVKIVMHWTEHPDKKSGLYRYDVATNKIEVLDKGYAYPLDFKFEMTEEPTGGPYPGLRSPWYDAKCVDIGSKRGVAQELDINPTGSASQFVDPLLIRQLVATWCRAPDWTGTVQHDSTGRPLGLKADGKGKLRLWLHLKPDGTPPLGRYGIGSDLSWGMGSTNSCLSLVNLDTGEKVGEYTCPFTGPGPMALLAVALCHLFKTAEGDGALLCWEQRGPGDVFSQRVYEMGYRKVWDKDGRDDWKPAYEGNWKPGWNPQGQNTVKLLEDYRAALAARKFLNHSAEALAEFLKFRYKSGGEVKHANEESKDDPSGARMNHGDRVIADAQAWMLAKPYWNQQKRIEENRVPVLSLEWRRRLRKQEEEES